MKTLFVTLFSSLILLSCASLGKPSSPLESCLIVKVEVQNPDSMPTENVIRLKFSDNISFFSLSPRQQLNFIKREFTPQTIAKSFTNNNTGKYIGTDDSDIPYRVPFNLEPGQIGIFRDKLVYIFLTGETQNSYRLRTSWVPLSNQERANIVRTVETNPDFLHWTWSPESLKDLRLIKAE